MYQNLILIDDDSDDAELFAEAVATLAPVVSFLHFDDEKEGLKQLLDKRVIPDLLFLDINMPSLSGWECLTQIRREETLHHVPVIMYSTSSEPSEREKADELGAAGLLKKPSDFKMLIRVLDQIVRVPADQLKGALQEL